MQPRKFQSSNWLLHQFLNQAASLPANREELRNAAEKELFLKIESGKKEMVSKESVVLCQVTLEGGNGSTSKLPGADQEIATLPGDRLRVWGVETAVTLVLCLGLLTWGRNLSGNIAIWACGFLLDMVPCPPRASRNPWRKRSSLVFKKKNEKRHFSFSN